MVKIIVDRAFSLHIPPEFHLENPRRYRSILLGIKDFEKYFEKPSEGDFWKLELIHSKEYLSDLWNLLNEGRSLWIDSDTYISEGTKQAILKSIGSLDLSLKLIKDEDMIYIPLRPPGHHAGINGKANSTQGFCLINNVAYLALNSVKEYGKTLVLDIDLHHGNGTEEILFGKKDVIYISTHGKYIYPGTGFDSKENIYNFPLLNVDDDQYISLLREEIFPIIEDFSPKIVLVSLGWDAHKLDPLSIFKISLKSYMEIFDYLKSFKTIYVLEGGYNYSILQKGSRLLIESYLKDS